MARASTEIQADIDRINAARARGVRRARMNGEEVEFPTDREFRAIIAGLNAELAMATGNNPSRIGVSYPYTSRGL